MTAVAAPNCGWIKPRKKDMAASLTNSDSINCWLGCLLLKIELMN